MCNWDVEQFPITTHTMKTFTYKLTALDVTKPAYDLSAYFSASLRRLQMNPNDRKQVAQLYVGLTAFFSLIWLTLSSVLN